MKINKKKLRIGKHLYRLSIFNIQVNLKEMNFPKKYLTGHETKPSSVAEESQLFWAAVEADIGCLIPYYIKNLLQ